MTRKNGEKITLRERLAGLPEPWADSDDPDESYEIAGEHLAKHFLAVLDADDRPPEMVVRSCCDNAAALGEDLYKRAKGDLELELRAELTGAQVVAAAGMAFQAYRGQ